MINKIFCVGLSHTGTTSLNQALNQLGIKSSHWPLDDQTYRETRSGQYNLTLLKRFQAITDVNTIPIYPQLDKTYPGSKFILTMRDKEGWMGSMRKVNEEWKKYLGKNVLQKFCIRFMEDVHLSKRGAFRKAWRRARYDKMIEFTRIAAYGGLAFEDASRLEFVYEQHNTNVKEYFKDRPGDLLIMNIFDGDGWERLCPFVEKAIPDKPFPHVISKPR